MYQLYYLLYQSVSLTFLDILLNFVYTCSLFIDAVILRLSSSAEIYLHSSLYLGSLSLEFSNNQRKNKVFGDMASYPLKELVPQDRVIFTYFILTFLAVEIVIFFADYYNNICH